MAEWLQGIAAVVEVIFIVVALIYAFGSKSKNQDSNIATLGQSFKDCQSACDRRFNDIKGGFSEFARRETVNVQYAGIIARLDNIEGLIRDQMNNSEG